MYLLLHGCRYINSKTVNILGPVVQSPPRGGGVLPYIGYMGVCRWRGYGFQTIWSGNGYGFQAIWSGIGSRNHKKLVWYRVPFTGLLTKDRNQEQLRIFGQVEGHKICKI